MTAFANLGFETAGASPGLAAGWAIAITSSVEAYAAFNSSGLETSWEDFELGWGDDGWTSDLGSTAPASFGVGIITPPPTVETFEVGWGVQVWLALPDSVSEASFGSSSLSFEDFESEWSNNSWSLGLGATTTGHFGTGSLLFENFETEWSNSSWSTGLGPTAAAVFDGASPQSFEDFEQVSPLLYVSIDPAADTIVAPAHGLANGTAVIYETTGEGAGGLNPNLVYFVVSTATNTFQLARTSGGTAVAIDTQGSGVQAIRVDPTKFWNDLVEI